MQRETIISRLNKEFFMEVSEQELTAALEVLEKSEDQIKGRNDLAAIADIIVAGAKKKVAPVEAETAIAIPSVSVPEMSVTNAQDLGAIPLDLQALQTATVEVQQAQVDTLEVLRSSLLTVVDSVNQISQIEGMVNHLQADLLLRKYGLNTDGTLEQKQERLKAYYQLQAKKREATRRTVASLTQEIHSIYQQYSA